MTLSKFSTWCAPRVVIPFMIWTHFNNNVATCFFDRNLWIHSHLKQNTCRFFYSGFTWPTKIFLHMLGSTLTRGQRAPCQGLVIAGRCRGTFWPLRHQRLPFLWHPRAQRCYSIAARKSGHWMYWTWDGGMESWEARNGRDTCLEKIRKVPFEQNCGCL